MRTGARHRSSIHSPPNTRETSQCVYLHRRHADIAITRGCGATIGLLGDVGEHAPCPRGACASAASVARSGSPRHARILQHTATLPHNERPRHACPAISLDGRAPCLLCRRTVGRCHREAPPRIASQPVRGASSHRRRAELRCYCDVARRCTHCCVMQCLGAVNRQGSLAQRASARWLPLVGRIQLQVCSVGRQLVRR